LREVYNWISDASPQKSSATLNERLASALTHAADRPVEVAYLAAVIAATVAETLGTH
jgi:hypothetical protein